MGEGETRATNDKHKPAIKIQAPTSPPIDNSIPLASLFAAAILASTSGAPLANARNVTPYIYIYIQPKT